MELPKLGERCSHQSCKQLDFLPFQCTHCKCIFCKEHYMPDNHKCNLSVNVPFNEVQPTSYYCKFQGCNSVSPVEMCCPVCKEHFCLQHRHHGCIDKDQKERIKERDKWDAPKKQFEIAKAEADRQIDTNITRARKKDNKTALKVQLMRLKGKAAGNKGIPTTDRAYFLVHLPSILSKKSQAVFVSKQWSTGRVIDSIADICGVINKNNELNANKLRLFHHDGGAIVCSEMEKKFEQLLNDGTVTEGESLILEYTSESCIRLEDIEHYKD
ncbi:hypothetical protein L9F63_001994 [Diploptera punctata]|uniref:AN1-type domain-containing protein n=1 Tax=Diploptera punctata TaxID=6984 RepID=A0AAD8EID0_DIPPU|nr:hypothetical protein L9F63_001994 [Diploptera punctata]